MAETVLEVVMFKLKAGADEESFKRASEAMMLDLRAMEGYLGRELRWGGDGLWMDLVRWRSLGDAQRAAAAFPTIESVRGLVALLDESSLAMYHFEQAQTYE